MRSELRAAIRDALIVLVVFLVAGAAAGWLWHAIWAPAPKATGYIISTGEPVFPSESYIRATGLYVLLAVGFGFALGAVLAFVLDRDELLTLFAVLVAAVGSGHLMAYVGNWLGPDDPPGKVTSTDQLADVVAALHVETLMLWSAMPAAALAGVLTVFLTFAKRRISAESTV